MSIFNLSFKNSNGNTVPLASKKGKVLLIVNTATKCGLAPQFKELESLHQKYKDQGLEVIGFPCNQFASQEPTSNKDMKRTCEINFGVTFQLSEKIDVNGPNTDPIFEYLKNNSRSMIGKNIKWNFTKFLVNRDGTEIKRFSPTTNPLKISKHIEKYLNYK